MVVAPLDFFVHDHAVEPFLRGLGNKFFGQGDVLLAGEAEAVNDSFDLVFGVFNAFWKSPPPVRGSAKGPGPFA